MRSYSYQIIKNQYVRDPQRAEIPRFTQTHDDFRDATRLPTTWGCGDVHLTSSMIGDVRNFVGMDTTPS